MRKFTLFGLLLTMAGSAVAGNVTGKMAERIKRMNDPQRPRVAVMGRNMMTAKTFQLNKAGIEAGASMTPRRTGASDPNLTASLTAPSYMQIYGPDGETWFYTQNTVWGEDYNCKSSEIVLYDNKHKETGRINFVVPEGKRVNVIEPYGQVTRKMFDRDDQTLEVLVYVHYLGNNYINTDSTLVYNTQGKRVNGYEGQISEVFSIQQNEWSTFQRAILQRSVFEATGDGRNQICLDVLRPAGWGETEPVVEHTFKVDEDLVYYCDGPCFTVCNVDNSPYYVLSYYRDTYVTGYDPATWEMIVREGNEYVLDVYDKNYQRVDSFGVSLDKPDDALYRYAAFNMFSDKDMSRNYFTSDNSLNYVITYSDYLTSTDDSRYSFDVFNGKGEHIKNICDNVEKTYFQLSDIRGHETQWAFMQAIGNSQQMQMVDLPSCNKVVTIPAEIGGKTISTTLNRYPKGDSYQYVISMGYAESDNDGNVIAPIGWYNKDLTLDRFVKFNLGPNGQYFTPLLDNESLDPYTFDTDDEHEYPFLAKIMREGSSVIDNTIVIANEDGSVLREFRGDDAMAIYTGGILNYGTANAEFFITTQTQTGKTLYNVDFYSLPFSRFAAGGDGTETSPYLIATLGDMQQIKAAPNAHYRLTADIDMSGYPEQWTPIETFTGTLDGAGHTLSNFSIAATGYNSGLFGTMGNGAKVKNLVMINPEVSVGEGCSYAGIIAGQASGDSIVNVHIYGARIEGQSHAVAGGLVGMASLYSGVAGCSFDGVINLPESESVGGMAGEIRTSTTVKASSATGTLTAAASLGGIVGTAGTATDIVDCRADVALKAENIVGGILGNNGSRSAVRRCHVTGSVEATKASLWDGLAAGGIIGSIGSDWTDADTVIVSGCVSAADIIIPAGTVNDGTANRIVGRTIANEDYEPGEKHHTELALADNYALSTVKVGGKTVASDEATSVNGATKDKAELTGDFFASLGYAYGTAVESPWKGAGMPVLWFENVAMGLTFSRSELTIAEGEKAEVVVTVYGTDASEIDLKSSDESVAAIDIVDETDNTVTISIECKKVGTAAITATAGEHTAECLVNCVVSGIEGATVADHAMSIRLGAGCIEAVGASRISIYSAGGQLAARAAGSSVSTTGMAKGVYIVVAADAEGRTTTGKVVVK